MRSAQHAATIAPFAAIGMVSGGEVAFMINQACYHFIDLYLLVLFVRLVPVCLHACV